MQRWKGQSDDCLEEKPRHLYIVLDDWSGGYSIRKIDLFGDTNLGYSLPSASSKFGGPSSKFGLLSSTDAPEDVEASFKALPPAFFKFEAPCRNPVYFSGAFGSKILAMQPMDPQFNFNSTAGVPVYDVHMRGLMIGPRQRLDPVDPIYIPVDGRLFALAAGSFEMLYPPPCTRSAWEDFVWMWHALPDPPFQREHVTSYAVHSDLRTIFVSTKGEGCVPATFSFDTRNACIWKQQGQWQMPFHGRAYFVPELNAWVGLSGKPSSSCRICSMGLISDKCEVTYHDDLVKFSKEELFGSPPTLFGATLVSLGGSKFCIVEYDAILGPDPGFTLKRLLRLTTFSLRYDKKGDLTTGNSIQCLEYMVPDLASVNMLQIPVAFWM